MLLIADTVTVACGASISGRDWLRHIKLVLFFTTNSNKGYLASAKIGSQVNRLLVRFALVIQKDHQPGGKLNRRIGHRGGERRDRCAQNFNLKLKQLHQK